MQAPASPRLQANHRIQYVNFSAVTVTVRERDVQARRARMRPDMRLSSENSHHGNPTTQPLTQTVGGAACLLQTIAGNSSGTSGSAGNGGPATSAFLSDPFGVALDANGNLAIADSVSGWRRESRPRDSVPPKRPLCCPPTQSNNRIQYINFTAGGTATVRQQPACACLHMSRGWSSRGHARV